MKAATTNRRRFIGRMVGATAGTIALPDIIAASSLGRAGNVAPGNRITLGFIGLGWMGGGQLLGSFLSLSGAHILAVCDVDRQKRERAKFKVESHYRARQPGDSYQGCDTYNDFRDLLARNDIDAVVIATPEHWHAIGAIHAAQAGKDIYCEKPLAYSIREGKAMVQAARRYGRVFQTGSQQRSDKKFRFACELVRNGYIGELLEVKTNIAGSTIDCNLPGEAPPDNVDWDMWLGPAPWRPCNTKLFMYTDNAAGTGWRCYREYSGGMMTDWGAHHFDIAQWGMGMDGSGPVEITPPEKGETWGLTYRYANGLRLMNGQCNGILFTGTQGKVEVNRGYLRTWPETLMKQPIGPNEIHLYESDHHQVDWLDCIRTRNRPIADVAIGYSSVAVCHLGIISMYLKRSLKWDPVNENFGTDQEANRLLGRSMRAPWTL